MSTTLGAVRLLIQDAIDDSSDETAIIIDRVINQSVREVGAEHFWQAYKKSTYLTSSILPGDIEKMYYVQPSDSDYLYFPMQDTDRFTNGRLYNWFLNMAVATPLLTGTDMVVTANSTSVTSATGGFDSGTHAGEYIRIGVDGGIYEISSVTDATTLVLTHAYRGASDTAQFFEIRPEGTLILGRTDEEGDAITDSEDILWYLARPLPLYNEYDTIPLPGTCEAIRIMALQRMLEGDKYDNDALKQQNNYMNALAHMKSYEPIRGAEPRNRDRWGNIAAFGRHRARVRYAQNGRRIIG